MRLNDLKIQRKGLILIAVPLIFDLSLVFAISYLQERTEQELLKETHARLMVDSTNDLLRLFYDAGTSLFLYHATANEMFLYRYGLSVSTIKDRVGGIKTLLKDNPKESLALKRVETVTNHALAVLEGASSIEKKTSSGDPTQYFRAQAEKKEFQNVLSEMVKALHTLSQEQRVRHFNQKEFLQLKTISSWVLRLAIPLCLLQVCVLALFFSRNISGRINIVKDNSRRLSRQESLIPLLGGRDEIAELDSVFHEMAATLAEAKRKERALVENAVDVIFAIDSENRFTTVNQACKQMWGYDPAQLNGKSLETVLSKEDLEMLEKAFLQIKTGQQSTIELSIMRTDGKMRFNEWSVHYVESERTLFCVAHDITERKELEKMKQDFFAMVSHDLRAPITSVYGTLELVLAGVFGKAPPGINKEIGSAIKNLERLVRLISDLLDLERLSAGKMSHVFDCYELAIIVNRSLESVKALYEAKEIHVEFAPSFVEVYCDSERIVQVMINLLSNAIKYSPAGGKLEILIKEESGRARVEIKDEGPGIPENLKNTIFSRYEQVGRQAIGSGLGLAICKMIIEEHEGEIGVENNPDKGSCFWFTLSLAEDH